MKVKMDEMDEMDEIWVKITIGTLFYHWKSILAIGSKSGSNLAIGSLYYHWNHIWAIGSTWAWSGPSDHAAWRRVNIAKKLAIYGRLIANISTIYCHQKRFFHKIVDLSPRADISLTYQRFLRKYLSFNFFL